MEARITCPKNVDLAIVAAADPFELQARLSFHFALPVMEASEIQNSREN